MFNKIKETGNKPTDEDKEKVKKDWESLNLYQRQVYIADQSEDAVNKRKAAKEEANARKEEKKAKEGAKAKTQEEKKRS